MDINEQLTCKYCKKIYNEPVTLNCCGDNICRCHIDQLLSIDESNTFLCPFCKVENANQNLCVNKLIQSLVKNKLHQLEFDSTHKHTLNRFKTEIEKLEAILKSPDNVIYEEIHELKRQVDLDREEMKLKIDTLANDLIQQLDSYEARFKAEYKKNLDSVYYNDLVESARRQLTENEEFLNLFSTKKEERDETIKKSEAMLSVLEAQVKRVKNKLFSDLQLTYKPTGGGDLFGELIIKVKKFIL